ncbi:MAG: hypothetical protein ACYDGN_11210 [Acidimicrobiales bacterium]
MAPRRAVRDWVDAQPPRSFFQVSDVPGSPRAVQTALSRMASNTDGPIARVRQGLYWTKPKATRFGSGRPDTTAATLVAAGKGAGPASWSATQALGLSTQVPAVPTVAVLGRAPKGLSGVRFVGRSNLERRDLTPLEIAVLEVLRDFPDHTDPGTDWQDLRGRLTALAHAGQISPDRVIAAAKSERRAGISDRARRLLDA